MLSSMRQTFPDAEITYLSIGYTSYQTPLFEPIVRRPAVIHGKKYNRPLLDKVIVEKEGGGGGGQKKKSARARGGGGEGGGGGGGGGGQAKTSYMMWL
ncbi:MAG: hypothetical protein FWE93_02005 [Alphaproteobacteria bacterium]|nr:hypothetical protein [Alphaproteobacteria bacterium]